MLRGWGWGRWRINRCRAVCSEAECGNGIGFNRAAGEGSGMFVPTIGALEGYCIAAARGGFVVASFDAPFIAAPMGIPGVAGRADGAGWEIFFAELSGVAELAAIAALGDEGGREHLFTLSWAGEEANGVLKEKGLIRGYRDNYRCCGFHPVSGIGLQEAGSGNEGASGKANCVSHGIEEVGRGRREGVNWEVVNCVICSGGCKIKGGKRVVVHWEF
jgi:hypothetical protein